MLAILRTLAIFVGDLLKSRGRLLAENLFLRYQLIIARRRALSRPRLYGSERALLVWMTRVGALYASSIMSALGHVWTAPWQELSNVAAALVGCGHVSGLLMRRGKPLALMLCADRVPIKTTHFKVR